MSCQQPKILSNTTKCSASRKDIVQIAVPNYRSAETNHHQISSSHL